MAIDTDRFSCNLIGWWPSFMTLVKYLEKLLTEKQHRNLEFAGGLHINAQNCPGKLSKDSYYDASAPKMNEYTKGISYKNYGALHSVQGFANQDKLSGKVAQFNIVFFHAAGKTSRTKVVPIIRCTFAVFYR